MQKILLQWYADNHNRCGACLCCGQRTFHLDVHSSYSRNGNICRKCVSLVTEELGM
jgi:hypothetical protein